MPYCFAPGCNHDSRSHSCRLFTFPLDEKRYRQWKLVCRRKDRDPNRQDRLCSCHFIDNDKKNLPSIFKHTNKRFMFHDPEQRKRVKKQTIDDTVSNENIAEFVTNEINTKGDAITHGINTKEDAIATAEMYFLDQENRNLKDLLSKGENRLSFNAIKEDRLVFQYTGLPTAEHFQVLVKLLKRFEISYFMGWKVETLSFEDQLLCCLMKLRLNLQYFDLGFRFKISTTTVQNIFVTFLNVLHEILFLGFMDKLPSREKNKYFTPGCFVAFPNTRVVLDCTEIEVAVPSSLTDQKAVFSYYKQRHTFKVLLGIAPNATITYVSDLFPGSTSDKMITKDSGILSHLVAGDRIICDKGFLISDFCNPLGVHVNIPPFLNNPQFSKEEVLATRQIARARIHVERAISRLKSFRILDFILPNMRQYSSKIVQVCAALVNMQYSLLKENEQCFLNEMNPLGPEN